MAIWKPVAVLTLFILSGCMTIAGKPAASSLCPFEQVWDTSIAALADFQFQTADKAAGVLETKWVEVEASTQAGAFQREVNKERLKYVVEVQPDGRGAAATVLQLREEWSPMGARSRQWRAIPGNSSEEASVATAITWRLKEKGC